MRSMFARVHDRTRSMVDEGLARPRQPQMRYFYDGHADGDVAPRTDFVAVAELRGLLSGFRDVRIERRSIDRVPLGPIEVSRLRLMRLGLDRLVGLDLYAVGYR